MFSFFKIKDIGKAKALLVNIQISSLPLSKFHVEIRSSLAGELAVKDEDVSLLLAVGIEWRGRR